MLLPRGTPEQLPPRSRAVTRMLRQRQPFYWTNAITIVPRPSRPHPSRRMGHVDAAHRFVTLSKNRMCHKAPSSRSLSAVTSNRRATMLSATIVASKVLLPALSALSSHPRKRRAGPLHKNNQTKNSTYYKLRLHYVYTSTKIYGFIITRRRRDDSTTNYGFIITRRGQDDSTTCTCVYIDPRE